MTRDTRPGVITEWLPHKHPRELAQWTYDDDTDRREGDARCIVCGEIVANKYVHWELA